MLKNMLKKKNNLLLLISIMLILSLSIVLVFIFVKKSNSTISKKVRNKIGMSIASVDGNNISFSDLELRTLASKSFFEKQNFEKVGVRIDFSTPEGKKRLKVLERMVLNNLIEGRAIENIAHSKGISVLDDEINMALKRAIDKSDPEFAKKRIELYNFTEKEFAKHVVRRELYINKLEDYYRKNNTADKNTIDKIKQVEQALKSGTNFSAVAKKYSEGITASNGGESGFFQRGQLEKEIENKAFTMKKGEVSDIIESDLGFHIIYINDVLNDDSGRPMMVSIKQILIKKKNFAQYFDNLIGKMKIQINSPDYTWDSSKNRVIFKDPSLVEFEYALVSADNNVE